MHGTVHSHARHDAHRLTAARGYTNSCHRVSYTSVCAVHFLRSVRVNIEHLAAKKYHDDEDKQKEMMDQVVAALDKEEANYR